MEEYLISYNWFKSRPSVFNKIAGRDFKDCVSNTENILCAMFGISKAINEKYENNDNEVLQAYAFYLDMQIEDLDSVSRLCNFGFFSSTSAVLRQSLTTLGRINYLYQNPSKLNDLKRLELENKWHISDLELIKVLKKKGILRDDEIYRKLCNSTHMNLRWHKFAKHAKSCGTINENAIGEVFGIILTAQEFALCSSNLLSDMLEKQFSVRMETEALNQLGMRWQENYEHFKLKYLKD